MFLLSCLLTVVFTVLIWPHGYYTIIIRSISVDFCDCDAVEVPPAYDEAINMQETSTSSPCPPPGNVANATYVVWMLITIGNRFHLDFRLFSTVDAFKSCLKT